MLSMNEKLAIGAIIGVCENIEGDFFGKISDAVKAVMDALGISGRDACNYVRGLAKKHYIDIEVGLGIWVYASELES